MSRRSRFPDLRTQPDAFITSAIQRLQEDRALRRSVPGGWLHMDRPLPFLCVYRHPTESPVEGAERLVLSQAAHLSISADPDLGDAVGDVLCGVARNLTERFGAFLVIELWPRADGEAFRIHAPPTEPSSTVATLAEALKDVDVHGGSPLVETVADPAPAPPLLPPLLTSDEQREAGVLLLGVEVPGFFLAPDRRPFPVVLRRLQRDLAKALQRTFFEFTTVQTSFRPQDFRALGPRRLFEATRSADRRLAEIAAQVDYLLAVTPVNADSAWEEFRDGGFRSDPLFHYRPLTVDPDLLKRSLYAVRLERVEDPTLAALFRAQRQSLDRQVSMLEDRCSDAFLPTSLQLYGSVDDDLVDQAEALMARVRKNRLAAGDCDPASGACLEAGAFADVARAELAHYRTEGPGLGATVEVRPDVPGVMVSKGQLLVGSRVQIPLSRADALVQHEVGTHIVTAANGRSQPLHLLHVGLAGYEETQEGLAVLAEYIAGGLTAARLMTLAARVIAVRDLVTGATFTETFGDLHEGHGLSAPAAFRVAMRVHRSGGLTKDLIYLRGLNRVLRYLADDHPIEPLLVGKVPLDLVPLVQELQWRGVLSPPKVQPRWLTAPESQERLATVRAGLSILDLVPEPNGGQ